MSGPLDGVRVLDFSCFQQGPYASVMLAALGAEVWKVERRDGGDPGRRLDVGPDGFSRYFEAHNRGKRSLTLDISGDAGREVALRLGERVEVVMENFRPGVMERLGLGYGAFRARNAGVIMLSASAFGAEGPLARRPGYDVTGQAMGVLMTLLSRGADAEPPPCPAASPTRWAPCKRAWRCWRRCWRGSGRVRASTWTCRCWGRRSICRRCI